MAEQTHEQASAQAIARSGAAIVLSKIFWVPIPEEMIGAWRVDKTFAYLQEYFDVIGCDDGGAIATLVEDLCAGTQAATERRLNVESTYLFRIGDDEVPASPYGSVWLEPERLLMGSTTQAVAVFYREHGARVADEAGDFIPDHISRELEFLAFMWRKEVEARGAGDLEAASRHKEAGQEFFLTHCAGWWPLFAQAVTAHAETTFFKSAGALLSCYTDALSVRCNAAHTA